MNYARCPYYIKYAKENEIMTVNIWISDRESWTLAMFLIWDMPQTAISTEIQAPSSKPNLAQLTRPSADERCQQQAQCIYAINCKKMQSLSLIQCNLMKFLIHKCSQRNCRLSPCTLYKLQWSCRFIHGIAQGIVYLSTCERISSTTIIFQYLPKSHMVDPYNLNYLEFCASKHVQSINDGC